MRRPEYAPLGASSSSRGRGAGELSRRAGPPRPGSAPSSGHASPRSARHSSRAAGGGRATWEDC